MGKEIHIAGDKHNRIQKLGFKGYSCRSDVWRLCLPAAERVLVIFSSRIKIDDKCSKSPTSRNKFQDIVLPFFEEVPFVRKKNQERANKDAVLAGTVPYYSSLKAILRQK